MLKTGALVLLALWAFGNLTRHTLGGFMLFWFSPYSWF
jgi:hypothetical protein